MTNYPGLVRVVKDGHTYLIDNLVTDLGGHLPDPGREYDRAQKASLYTPEREEQRGDMPGKVDEAKWSKAKAEAKKSYPDLDESNPRHWKIVSTIYKNMGGAFSKEIEKSMAVVEYFEKITPPFILDPRLWVSALKKSGAYENPEVAKTAFAYTMECYAELGGQLIKSSVMDEIEKGGAHKYAKKVALPGGGFRYIYPGEEAGEAREASAKPKVNAPANAAPEAKQAPTGSYAKTINALSAKNDAEARASLQNVDYDNLHGMHSEMNTDDPKRALVAQAMQEKRRAANKTQSEASEKTVEKSQTFEDFSKKNWSEVSDSLRKSHPDWDSDTLDQRCQSQLTVLFKFQ